MANDNIEMDIELDTKLDEESQDPLRVAYNDAASLDPHAAVHAYKALFETNQTTDVAMKVK